MQAHCWRAQKLFMLSLTFIVLNCLPVVYIVFTTQPLHFRPQRYYLFMKYTIFQPKKPIFLLHICSKSSTFAGLFAKGHFSSLPIVLSFSSLPLPLSCSCQWSGKYFVYCPDLGDLRGPREILISGVLFPPSLPVCVQTSSLSRRVQNNQQGMLMDDN